jgi:carbon monoxide dehydrogenase subunit G
VELNGTYTFDAPREVIWDALMNPEVLAKILPGVEKLDKISDTEFEGVMNVRVGPVQGKFKGTVVYSDVQAPERFHMEVKGRGAAGFLKGGGDASLIEEDGKTVLTYGGSGDVGGRIAGVGQRLVETTGKSIVRQGLESLDRLTQAQLQPALPDEAIADDVAVRSEAASADYAPPSELEVALGVAKDIFEEYVPEEQRPLALGLLGAMVLLMAAWLLKQLFSD